MTSDNWGDTYREDPSEDFAKRDDHRTSEGGDVDEGMGLVLCRGMPDRI